MLILVVDCLILYLFFFEFGWEGILVKEYGVRDSFCFVYFILQEQRSRENLSVGE